MALTRYRWSMLCSSVHQKYKQLFTTFRTSRPRRAKEGGTTSEPHHQLSQGSRDLQSGCAEEGPTIFFKDSGSSTDPEVTERSGTPEDLLPQAGGPCSGTTTHREDVCFKHPLLRRGVPFPGIDYT